MLSFINISVVIFYISVCVLKFEGKGNWRVQHGFWGAMLIVKMVEWGQERKPALRVEYKLGKGCRREVPGGGRDQRPGRPGRFCMKLLARFRKKALMF